MYLCRHMHVCLYKSIQQLCICTIQRVSFYMLCRYLHSCRHLLYTNIKFTSSQIKGSILYCTQSSRTGLPGGEKGIILVCEFHFENNKD